MIYLYLLLSLFTVDMLAAMSPGPNFLLVVQTSIQRTRHHAAAVVLGLRIRFYALSVFMVVLKAAHGSLAVCKFYCFSYSRVI
jgi:threonine/homoserine/homoserine lactone efflux protein